MGADQPPLGQPQRGTATLPKHVLIPAALLLLVIAGIRAGLAWIGAAAALNPKEVTKLQTRLQEIDDSQQYALVAKEGGAYPCLHSGRTTCFLKTGEVWKYGVTSKGALGRYTMAFLISNRVSYIIQFKGTFSECLKQEQIKLFNYPYLPENMARQPADRLPRPPYNRVMR